MNLRLVQFSLGPGKRSAAEAIADKVVPAHPSTTGVREMRILRSL